MARAQHRASRRHRGDRHGFGHLSLACVALAAASSVALATTLSTQAASASRRSSSKGPSKAGTLTVLEGAALAGDWPSGLDPATSTTTLANASMLDAIYGELFEVGPHDRIVPDLATSASIGDGGRTLKIELRHGVSFSDGTPFDAAAVVDNFRRDLANAASTSNPAWPPHPLIRAAGRYSVLVRFSAPDGAALNQLLDTNLTWIVSPSALQRLGDKRFSVEPVGAGPFEVVSDTPSVKLVLKANPHYWDKGHPYLKGLTFESVANDESALEDLRAHDAQAYEFMSTPQLVRAFKDAGFNLSADPGPSVIDVELNTAVAPFDNLQARQAIYDAIDAAAFNKKIFNGTCPLSESFTGPGGLFYEPRVPGYRTYDLAQAKALVSQVHGIAFTLYYLQTALYGVEAPALQTMFEDAGMQVTIKGIANIGAAVAEFNTHTWPAFLWVMGSYDPAGGVGVSFFLQSHFPFSGVDDPVVDQLISQGAAAISPQARSRTYNKLASYLSQQAYVPFICAPTTWDIAAKGVSGPGLTSTYGSFGQGPLVQWENVSLRS
jgi:peptide/nickel transport system substrate-binding protein